MEKTGMDAALSDYTQKCKGYESDANNFSLYVHGYLIPTQKKMREEGLFEHGAYKYCLSFSSL